VYRDFAISAIAAAVVAVIHDGVLNCCVWHKLFEGANIQCLLLDIAVGSSFAL
jgi:hypothetical protein